VAYRGSVAATDRSDTLWSGYGRVEGKARIVVDGVPLSSLIDCMR